MAHEPLLAHVPPSPPFVLPQGTRQIANEITDRGAKLYDLLGQEPELRQVRMKALRFLDAVASNLDSRAEHAYMER